MIDSRARIEKMERLVEEALAPTHLKIIDDSHLHVGHAGAEGGAGHFTIEIDSPKFENKSMINQHKLVYSALSSMMPDEIHALSIKTVRSK